MNINMPQIGSLVQIRGLKATLVYEVVHLNEAEGELHLRIQAVKITKKLPGPVSSEVEYRAGDIVSIQPKCPQCGADL